MYHLLKYLEDPKIIVYDTEVWKKTTSRRSGWIQMPQIVADGGEDLDHGREYSMIPDKEGDIYPPHLLSQ